MKSIFSKEQNKYLQENYDKKSYKEIAEILGFTERQIRGRINNMGLSKTRKFDKSYFDNIDSKEKAYWLGFIYADGYIVCNQHTATYELGIEINSQDNYLLKRLVYNLGNVHKVEYKHNYKSFNGYNYETDSCILRIYSKQICQSLINLNIVPNKTNSNLFPQNNNYFFDFLRGFVDGDGCIYVDKKNHIMINFTNSNEEFLSYINNKVNNLIGISGKIYKEKDKKYRLIYFRQNDIKILLDKIYDNKTDSYLIRKYNIYKSYYGFAS